MKIPKYIENALRARTKATMAFNKADYIVSRFVSEHNIDTDPADTYGGVESIVNPNDSEMRVRNAILNHKEEK